MKLVHLVGFIRKKFVTMHGHMNVKIEYILLTALVLLFQTRNKLVFVKLSNFCTMCYHINIQKLPVIG